MVWLYVIMTVLIGLFCLSQFILFCYYLANKHGIKYEKSEVNYPFITVQLPIYNEKYVAERIINAAINLNYPADKIEIQVLDDSTDETQIIISQLVASYRSKGYNIHNIHRKDREGYKAGALRHGMTLTDSKYFCIFDADFIPKADFLEKAIPYFQDNQVGVVQSRWGHINENENFLTQVQSFQLNVHFSIEQGGRYYSGNFLQFNGTAGIWRREAIEDGEGWQIDTLTEDLDLSYRAQLKGWKIIFCEHLVAPAELPSDIAGLKSQQFRWMKGGAQTAKKLLGTIWGSPISYSKKIWSTLHLLSSTVYFFIFLVGILSFPMTVFADYISNGTNPMIYLISMMPFIFCTTFYANVILSDAKESLFKKTIKFVIVFPLSLAMNIGFSLHNSIAVLEGWIGIKSAFLRTPKKGVLAKSNYSVKMSSSIYFEGLMALYFLLALAYGIIKQEYSFFAFHILCVYGYLAIFILSLKVKFANKSENNADK